MQIKIISFTVNGAALSMRLSDMLAEHETASCYKGKAQEGVSLSSCEKSLADICRTAFEEGTALVFIGAMGIAVRSIAPFALDKLKDPPVIVMDELGKHVIPVLSGHMGGANELAMEIASLTGAEAVITTATDLNQAFPVDLVAKENGLRIVNRDGIAKVSSSVLKGRPVTISIKNYPPAEPVDVIISEDPECENMASIRLCPGRYAVGIGCRKGKSAAEIKAFAEKILADHGIDPADVGAVATIDIKADETGIKALAGSWKVPLITYEAALLEKAPGSFTASAFVKQTTGVDNVSERAAVLAAGAGSKLIIRKQAANGITVAVAERQI